MPTSNKTRALWPMVLIVLVALAAGGCSTSTSTSGLSLVGEQGNHPANFLAAHPGFAVSSVAAQCKPCHGDELTGGIAKVSCFTAACHHGTIPGWVSPGSHGAAAKQAPVNTGFASCQICHASDFSGGGAGVSCFLCHTTAPHPADWRSVDVYKHTDTAGGNASVCADCHLAGANSPISPPSPPALPGTSPGCFNSTLCHGADVIPHVLGSTWTDPNPSFHGLTAKQNLSFCQTCHGTPGTVLFDGGFAPTACSACHPAADAHPTTWFEARETGFPPYTPSHRNAGNRSVACAICHKVDGTGAGPNSAAPSCFSASFTNADGVPASCHASGPGAPNHLVPFLDPVHLGVTQADFDSDCSNCHAVSGSSPVSLAHACQVCHTAGSPLSATSNFGVCTSCHGGDASDPLTTGPDGTVYPNVAGAHAKHRALNSAGTPVYCDTCHDGLGFVTQAHYDRANGRPGAGGRVPPGDLAFDNTYDAQSGASSFDNMALTCSNVSCHGGITTPRWDNETIVVNTDCTQCHALGTTEYNSYDSGEHERHVNEEIPNERPDIVPTCVACHDTTGLAVNHFTNLSTSTMEGPAAATIRTGLDYNNPNPGSCTPNAVWNTGCHGTERW